jgi:hypothetical protein
MNRPRTRIRIDMYRLHAVYIKDISTLYNNFIKMDLFIKECSKFNNRS